MSFAAALLALTLSAHTAPMAPPVTSTSAPGQDACVAGELAPVVVQGHGQVAHLAEELQGRAKGLYEDAARYTGAEDCAPIQVHLTQDNVAARALLPAWHLPPWAAGAARPDERTIVLTVHNEGLRQDRERVLVHELAHLAVAAAAKEPRRVPRWFDEGVARRLAGEDGQDDDAVLARAKLGGRLLLLEGLEKSFPGSQASAAIAYAVSGRAIELLETEHGDDVVRRVLARVSAGEKFDDALKAESGIATWQLTGRVERSVTTWHAWMTVMKDVDVFLGLGGFLLVLAGWRARRRVRERIEAMPDYGGPEHDAPGLGLVRWRVGPAR